MNFFEKLQASEDYLRRRWFALFSLVAVAAVFFLWKAYVGTLFYDTPGSSKNSIVTVLDGARGAGAFIYEIVGGVIYGISTFLVAPRSYDITPGL